MKKRLLICCSLILFLGCNQTWASNSDAKAAAPKNDFGANVQLAGNKSAPLKERLAACEALPVPVNCIFSLAREQADPTICDRLRPHERGFNYLLMDCKLYAASSNDAAYVNPDGPAVKACLADKRENCFDRLVVTSGNYQLCKHIDETEYSRSQFKLEGCMMDALSSKQRMEHTSFTVDMCNKIEERFKTAHFLDLCLMKTALDTKDPNICGQLSDRIYNYSTGVTLGSFTAKNLNLTFRGHCLLWLALSKDSPQICDDNKDPQLIAACRNNLAEIKGAHQKDVQETQAVQAAIAKNTPEACARIEDLMSQIGCYVQLATTTKDVKHCAQVTDKAGVAEGVTFRDLCIENVASVTKDKTLCEKTSSDMARNACLGMAGK